MSAYNQEKHGCLSVTFTQQQAILLNLL